MAESRNLKMPEINSVTVAGNLTRDPELRYLTSGVAVCEFGIAINRRWKDKTSGEKREDTSFINVTCWAKTAEYISEHVKKGYPVLVEGKLRSEKWEDKQSGAMRTAIKIQADRVQQLSWENFNGGSEQRTAQPTSAPVPRPIEEPEYEDDLPF